MYTTYFGFKEKPFTLTPNPRFIFLSKNHKEAFAHLLYGINNRYGFIALTGEVGTGKTTVLRTLLGQLQDDAYRMALIFSPSLTSVELLRTINSEFGLPAVSELSNELLAELNGFLLEETASGRTVVLVIDEAQTLQPEVLEQVRQISNLETESDKLIQIILAGQPELDVLLSRPDLRQLNQRIAVRYKLGPMSREETRSYIRQRMEVAGETGGVVFTWYALTLIHLFARGIPRMINILCDRSLLTAYGDERRLISASIVVRAMKELMHRSQTRRLALMATVSALFCTLLLLSIWFQRQSSSLRGRITIPGLARVWSAPTASLPAAADPAADTVVRLKREIATYDQNDTHLLAFNALADAWSVRPIKLFTEGLDVPDMFRRIAARRNLRVTLFRGSLDDVIRTDLPFLVMTTVTGALGEYAYAVTAAGNGTVNVTPALFDSHTLPKDDLAAVANGIYYLVWQNTGQIPDSIIPGEKRSEVRWLQELLKRAGMYRGDVNGVYSPETLAAVRSFQLASGLQPNEAPGELTLALLSRYDGSRKIPSLKGS